MFPIKSRLNLFDRQITCRFLLEWLHEYYYFPIEREIFSPSCLTREGFVLDFCPTFRILSFVMSGKNLRSPFTKQLTGLFCSLRSNPFIKFSVIKRKDTTRVPFRFMAEREGFEPSERY